jgi:hypothetical protein
MTVVAEMKFPVLWVNLAQGNTGSFSTYEESSTWGMSALGVGFQQELHLCDANLGYYEVIRAVAGKTVRHRFLRSRLVHVDLELSTRRTVSLDTAKEFMQKAIALQPGFWDSDEGVSLVIARVNGATCLEQPLAIVS